VADSYEHRNGISFTTKAGNFVTSWEREEV